MPKSKLNPPFLATGMILLVAGPAVFAQVRSGSYSSAKVSSIEQTAPVSPFPDAIYAVASFPSLAPELAEGEGRAETESFCATCHSTRYITMQPPLPAAAWDAVANKMIKTHGASIPDPAAKKIISYLQAHYTPENRKQ